VPIKIIYKKPIEAAPTVMEPVIAKQAAKAAGKPPTAKKDPYPNLIPKCKYCGHEYLNGGCDFERQKLCTNHPPGKVRVVATKSLD
jgi:hypothetical protein